MAKSSFHILNGDALKEQFPAKIKGDIIVARECLVDGDVSGHSLDDFYRNRASFLEEVYADYTLPDYTKDVIAEFNKIKKIPEGSTIYLWFEDDLFCQVNFWFVSWLIDNHSSNSNTYLVRPSEHTSYGFGGLSEKELYETFLQKQSFKPWDFAMLWNYYKKNDLSALKEQAQNLHTSFPFVFNAVDAHLARIPTGINLGRPTETLKQIMNELHTEEFAPIFKEFCKRESIYGFGDLQVRRLFNELISTMK